MDLIVHSLYSHKEVFFRELVRWPDCIDGFLGLIEKDGSNVFTAIRSKLLPLTSSLLPLFTQKGLTIGYFPRRRPFWESLVILLIIVFYAFQGSQLGYHGVMLMPKRSLSDLIMMLDCITSINRPGIQLYNVDLLKLEPLMKPYQVSLLRLFCVYPSY
ncbi:uncharacterized protein LOC121052784 [Rosa chinensis]|nr:uncharacterized protein LOC121052784 [Rosa chinensis]